MLHTKFRENWPAGSGEGFLKGFYRCLYVPVYLHFPTPLIYGHGGHFGHVTSIM